MSHNLLVTLSTISAEEWPSMVQHCKQTFKEKSDAQNLISYIGKRKADITEKTLKQWRERTGRCKSQRTYLNLLSKVNLGIEQWVVSQQVLQDQWRYSVELIKYYNRRGAFTLADKRYRQLLKELGKVDTYSPYLDEVEYWAHYYQFFSDNPIKYAEADLFVQLVQSSEHVGKYNTTLYENQRHHWKNLKGVEVKENPKKCMLLQNMDSMIQEGSVDAFLYCLKELKDGKVRTADDFYKLLTFYCIRSSHLLWNKGKIAAEQVSSVYELALENNVFGNSGKIPFSNFNSIVNSLGKVKGMAWTDEFIAKWGPKIEAKEPENAIQLARAFNYFNHGAFEEALSLLPLTQTHIISTRGEIHLLTVMVYYELKSEKLSELLDSLDRLQRFLTRNQKKHSAAKHQAMKGFERVVRKLAVGKAVAEEQAKNVSRRSWVVKKIRELQ